MVSFSKVISTSTNNVKQLLVKVLKLGRSDAQTPIQASPHGIDSNPVANMVAVYAASTGDGNNVIVGYLTMQALAKPGELRLYGTDAQGVEKFYVWLKDNGTIEIGGDTNYAVKYNELAQEFNKLKQDFNNLVTKYNTHTHTDSVGGSTLVTGNAGTANMSDITQAKNDKIKTIG